MIFLIKSLFIYLLKDTNDTFNTENKKDECVVFNYDTKIGNEKEFLKRVIASIQQSNKKVCVERPETVKNNNISMIRYLAYNGIV